MRSISLLLVCFAFACAEPPAPDPVTLTEPDMPDPGPMCMDTQLYADDDGDGFGDDGRPSRACLTPEEDPGQGLTRMSGDCADNDPLQHEGAPGVCGDWVDDNCDGMDESCPSSMPGQMNIPAWDCTGEPPSNVYAWARFEEGNGYFKPGGCFVFFEGNQNVFYVQRVGIERETPCPGGNDSLDGCTCPSTQQFPAYDRRMYAFTRRGDTPDCPKIILDDRKLADGSRWETQPVSNECRKYLLQMHYYDLDYSHVATGVEQLEKRLSEFDVVEVVCLEDKLFGELSLPHTDLMSTTLVKNESFEKM